MTETAENKEISKFKQFLIEKEEQEEQEKQEKMDYPNGVYVAVVPDTKTQKSIEEFQKEHLKDVEINTHLHTTLIYSAEPRKEKIPVSTQQHKAEFDSFDLFGENKEILVMKIKSDSLHQRNKELTDEYGFISDYDKYIPHITLAYNTKNVDINKLPKFKGSIVLQKEYTEDLDEDA